MLEPARKELRQASELLVKISNVSVFSDFEDIWVQILIRIERIYDKATAEMRETPQFLSWNGKRAKERATDPLLRYLQQARHADQHTVQSILQHQNRKVVLPPGAEVYVEVVPSKTGELGYRFTNIGKVKIQVEPAKAILPSFKNRGVRYHPPKMHLGQNIEMRTIPEILQMAIHWYEHYLSTIEAEFQQ